MSTATYLRANRLLDLIGCAARQHGLLLLSKRYTTAHAERLVEIEARLRRWLLEMMDNESRRAA